MPRNLTGGKGAKKRKNGGPEIKDPSTAPFKDEEQDYGYVIDEMGDRRFRLRIVMPPYLREKMIKEGKEIPSEPEILLGRVRPKKNRMKSGKAFSVKRGSFVLVSRRDFQADICDIIYNYRPDEIEWLKKKKQLPYSMEDPNSKTQGAQIIFKKRESNEVVANKEKVQESYFDVSLMPPSEDEEEDDSQDDDSDEEDKQEYDSFGNLI